MPIKIDPLAVINMKDLAARMGVNPKTIKNWLARDVIDRSPGKRFPVPMTSENGSVEWRELTIVVWLEIREGLRNEDGTPR